MPEIAATTAPLLNVLRRLEVTFDIASEVVVAALARIPALKVLSCEKMFAVVVENAVVNAPVFALYASGNTALSEVLDILLLKVVKSVFERKPLVVSDACDK